MGMDFVPIYINICVIVLSYPCPYKLRRRGYFFLVKTLRCLAIPNLVSKKSPRLSSSLIPTLTAEIGDRVSTTLIFINNG